MGRCDVALFCLSRVHDFGRWQWQALQDNRFITLGRRPPTVAKEHPPVIGQLDESSDGPATATGANPLNVENLFNVHSCRILIGCSTRYSTGEK